MIGARGWKRRWPQMNLRALSKQNPLLLLQRKIRWVFTAVDPKNVTCFPSFTKLKYKSHACGLFGKIIFLTNAHNFCNISSMHSLNSTSLTHPRPGFCPLGSQLRAFWPGLCILSFISVVCRCKSLADAVKMWLRHRDLTQRLAFNGCMYTYLLLSWTAPARCAPCGFHLKLAMWLALNFEHTRLYSSSSSSSFISTPSRPLTSQ